MHDMMKKLLEKKAKEGKTLSEPEKDAKMSVLHELRKHMDDMLSDKVDGLKKVSVASDSAEGLQKGLDKAQELLKHPEDSEVALPSHPELEEGSEEEEMHEEENMSDEDIDSEIARLQALKEKRKA